MTITMPDVADTRARMLQAYRNGLMALIEDATQRPGDVADGDNGEIIMTLGDWDGVPVVTRKRLDEAIHAIFGQAIPAPSETTVEVSTPATVYLSTACPECGLARVIPVSLRAQLTIDDDGAELAAKAKSKSVPHVCGQLALPEPAGEDGQEQIEVLEAIESLVSRVHGLLAETLEEDVPTLDTIRLWDRATIDQVDHWATARMANNGGHPESCSAQFATDGTTGERVCDCGLAEAVPPLPRVLGGEADPEPVAEAEDDAPICRVCGCTDEDACDPPCYWVVTDLCSACDRPEPNANDVDFGEGAPNAEGEDDDLLPGEPVPS